MTICSKMYEALDKRLEEKKSLEEIGNELCDAVIDPRGKAIRLIKSLKCQCKNNPCTCKKGEKYLKENSEWLDYHPEFTGASKNFDAMQDLRDDARNNGVQTSVSLRQEPPYEKQSPLTMTSLSDSFQPDEVIYEKQDAEIIPQCRIFIPKLSDIKKCPCGCGYGYCDINEKWYSKMDIKNLSED